LDHDSWIVSSLNHDLFSEMDETSDTWRRLIADMGDDLKLLADAPDDPEVN
jgi:hypothetical protein